MSEANTNFFHMNVSPVKTGRTLEKHRYNHRDGKYGHKKDLIANGTANMPYGVAPVAFYSALDANERKNGGAIEVKVAIPRILSTSQQCQLAEDLARTLAGPCQVSWALHRPKAALEGGDQPHLHALISRRTPDGITRPFGADL